MAAKDSPHHSRRASVHHWAHLDRAAPVQVPITWANAFIGLLLLPVVWVTLLTVCKSLSEVAVEHAFWRTPQFWFFNLGLLIWLVVGWGFRGPTLTWLYVFGHEWTHAIFAVLSGAKLLRRPEVSSQGGQVVTTKSNLIISLSPYFFPFYSVLLGLAYVALGWMVELGPLADRWFFGLLGLTWGFHVSFTVWMVCRKQPDLRQNGTFFSLTFVALINLLVLAALFVFASPTLDWRGFTLDWLDNVLTLIPGLEI